MRRAKKNWKDLKKELESGRVVKCNVCVFFQVCLGAEAEDKFHMVEVEGLTYDGKSTKVPLVILKPSVMPSVSKRQMFFSLFVHGL